MAMEMNVRNTLTQAVLNNHHTIQLASLFIGVIIVFCMLFALLYQEAVPKLVRNQIEMRAESIASFLATTMLEQVATRDYLNINKLAESVSNLPEVGLVVVIDSNGEVLAGMFNNIAVLDSMLAIEIKKNGFPQQIINEIHLASKSPFEKYSLQVGGQEIIGYGVKLEDTNAEVHVGILADKSIKNTQTALIPYMLLFIFTAIITSIILFVVLRSLPPSYITWSVMVAIVLLGMQQPTYAAGYRLSVTPRFSAKEMFNRLGPLAKLLGENLRSPVELVLASNFQNYENNLQEGQYDIAFSNPTHYSKASILNEVIAMESKDNGPRMRGSIIVRVDSTINSVHDLIGRSVAIVAWDSTGGFLSQKVFLEEQGILPKEQLRLQEAHDNKQENVLFAVFHNDVAAGFINEDAFHIVDNYLPANQIRVLANTAWLPNWAVSVKRSLPIMTKEKIRRIILGMRPGDPVLNALKTKEFVGATDSDYDVIRKALGVVTAQPVISPTCAATVAVPAAVVPVTATTTSVATATKELSTQVLTPVTTALVTTAAVGAAVVATSAATTSSQPMSVPSVLPAVIIDKTTVAKPSSNKGVAVAAKVVAASPVVKKVNKKSKKKVQPAKTN